MGTGATLRNMTAPRRTGSSKEAGIEVMAAEQYWDWNLEQQKKKIHVQSAMFYKMGGSECSGPVLTLKESSHEGVLGQL